MPSSSARGCIRYELERHQRQHHSRLISIRVPSMPNVATMVGMAMDAVIVSLRSKGQTLEDQDMYDVLDCCIALTIQTSWAHPDG